MIVKTTCASTPSGIAAIERALIMHTLMQIQVRRLPMYMPLLRAERAFRWGYTAKFAQDLHDAAIKTRDDAKHSLHVAREQFQMERQAMVREHIRAILALREEERVEKDALRNQHEDL